MCLHESYGYAYGSGQQSVIGAHHNDDLAISHAKTLIHRPVLPHVGMRLPNQPPGVSLQYFSGIVRGAIIQHYILNTWIVLVQDAPDCLIEIRSSVVSGRDYSNQRQRFNGETAPFS